MRQSLVLHDARREAHIDFLRSYMLSILSSKGSITNAVKNRIENETDIDILDQWFKCAIYCVNTEEFSEKIQTK